VNGLARLDCGGGAPDRAMEAALGLTDRLAYALDRRCDETRAQSADDTRQCGDPI
jgi:hypothetical protein